MITTSNEDTYDQQKQAQHDHVNIHIHNHVHIYIHFRVYAHTSLSLLHFSLRLLDGARAHTYLVHSMESPIIAYPKFCAMVGIIRAF